MTMLLMKGLEHERQIQVSKEGHYAIVCEMFYLHPRGPLGH